MTNMMNLFKVLIVVQLFYAFCITGVTYALPSDTLVHAEPFTEVADDIDLQGVSTQIEDSMQKQTNIPVVELGALVFYSGNILIDLLLNFAFAIPQMIGLILSGIMLLLNINSDLLGLVQMFNSVVIMALYMIGIMQLLIGVRSGRLV